jgi:hypothetical protein
MKALKLQSCLAAQIQSFISLRQLSGTDYQSQARLLGYFDRFLVKEKIRQPRLSQQIRRAISTPFHILHRALSPTARASSDSCVNTSHGPILSPMCPNPSERLHRKRRIGPTSTTTPRSLPYSPTPYGWGRRKAFGRKPTVPCWDFCTRRGCESVKRWP